MCVYSCKYVNIIHLICIYLGRIICTIFSGFHAHIKIYTVYINLKLCNMQSACVTKVAAEHG